MTCQTGNTDLFGFSTAQTSEGVIRYASGVLSPAIWAGYTRGWRAVCVAASQMNDEQVERTIEYASAGADVMVDSGAFVYRDKPQEMPWERVIWVYKRIACAAAGAVTLILPDEVGSQQGSLARLSEYGARIQRLALDDPDKEALLPVQVGELKPTEFITQARKRLPYSLDGIALPSCAAAFPPHLLCELADAPTPKRVHFLGIGANTKGFARRKVHLDWVWPDAVVSVDSVEHRSMVGQGKPITQTRRTLLDEALDQALDQWDDTEDDDTQQRARQALAEQFPMCDDEQIDDLMASQWGAIAQVQAFSAQCDKRYGPEATSESIYRSVKAA